MARRKASPFKSEKNAQGEPVGEAPADAQMAKVTLVKPAQEEEMQAVEPSSGEAEAISSEPAAPRPKFGRAPLRKIEEPKVSLPLPEAPAVPEALYKSEAGASSAPSGIPAPSTGESRFVFFLLALFILINLALIFALHNHRQRAALSAEHPATAASSVPQPAPAPKPSQPAPLALAPAPAAVPAASALPLVPPTPSVPRVLSVASTPQPKAASAAPLPPLPSLPAAAEEAPPAPAPVNRQDLLSVLNKD